MLMRLALLTHEPFFPPSGGGSAEAVYLVEEFVRRGHEVDLFCPRIDDRRQVEERFGVRLQEFTAWPMGRYTSLRSLKYLAYPWFLERLVLRAAPRRDWDVLVSQHAISAVAAGRLKRRLNRPVVMNFLDFLTGFMDTWPRYRAPRMLLRKLQAFELSIPRRFEADAVLTVSDELARRFINTGMESSRVFPIKYGYDAESFLNVERSAPRPSRPTIVMHGSFDHHHLGGIAQDALIRVHRERPDVCFRFIGRLTPALNSFLADVRRRAPDIEVDCTGFVAYREIAGVLSDAAVGVVPYEASQGAHCAFVAKVVEYLAVGLPVATTSLKAVSDYFADEPMVRLASFDGESLAQSIVKWLEDPPGEEMRRAAREHVRKELDWKVICKNAVDRVEEVRDCSRST